MEAKSSVQNIQGECETYSHQGQTYSNITPPMPASARTMSISELRWKIFQLVDLEPSRKKTLLALALTCESFSGPALDLLWRELNGLGPLIRCLPQTLWKLEKQKAQVSELEFQRAMTLDDWSIFCKYNHRVRSLRMSRWVTPYYQVGPEIWGAIGCPPFTLPLLPNLTSLTWDTPSGTFLCIRSFVTQKLTKLHINAYYPGFKFSPSVQSTLSCIPMLCPSVSHFELNGGAESGDASVALQCWSQLISARTGKISDAAILHLSKLPSLQELYLELRSTPISPNTQQLLQRPVFCALHLLDVESETLALLDAFFETLSIAPKILSFNVTYGVDSARILPASISRISNACAHNALERLRILVEDTGAGPGTSISATVFQPLCAFRNLRELDFDVRFDVRLDDATLLQMAKAWPLLEELMIRGEYSPSSSINITTNTLVSLLQHCPRLASIGIAVDWSAVDRRDISPEIPYEGFTHKSLSDANFGSSKICHAIGVAAFISAIAPKLENVSGWNHDCHYDHPDFEEYSAKWELVQDLVNAFSVVRKQGTRMRETIGDVGGVEDDHRGE